MIKPVVMTLVQFKDIIKEKSSDELFFCLFKDKVQENSFYSQQTQVIHAKTKSESITL